MKSVNMIWKWLILAGLATLSIYVVLTPPGSGEKQAATTEQKKRFPGIRLGIDLAGGTSFTVKIDEPRLRAQITDDNPSFTPVQINEEMHKVMANADDRVLEVLRKRVDGMGVNEPVIYKGKDHSIVIQLPGADAKQRENAERSIESAAFLEFRLVHKDNANLVSRLLSGKPAPEGFVKDDSGVGYIPTAEYATLYRDADYRRRLSRFGCESMTSYEMMFEKRGTGNVYIPNFVAKKRELTGAELQSAAVDQNSMTGELQVSLRLNKKGALIFKQVTEKYCTDGSQNPGPGRQLAIILDGVLYSAPMLKVPILDGQASISGGGGFTASEANMLRNTLNAGALPTPVQIIEKRVIDPTLGRDAINSGLMAAAGGAIAVFLFMLVYYFYCGLIANIALALDLLLLPAGMIIASGFLSFFDRSVDSRFLALPVFTMPGIAGIVLTIGMAVDANVLIFERIREEFRLGKSARAAVDAGYDRAFLAIFDSNITTLLTAVILFIFGTGPIKGFAITLSAGIIISMFTVLVVTRMIFNLTVPEGRVKPYKMLSVVKENIAFDFLGKARPALMITGVLIVASILLFSVRAAKSPSSVLSVDLTGGVTMEFTYANQVPSSDITTALSAANIQAEVQYQGFEGGERILQVRTGITADDEAAATLTTITSTLAESFPDAAFAYKASDTIGSSVGAEMRKAAFYSVVLALIGMILYITLRFELGFALGGIAALAATVFVTIGVYTLLGRQISLTTVAALLTIVGYEINDTIVVFDRIREDLIKDPRNDFKTIVNQALNRTLSRTFLTSFTTLLPVLALVGFGSGAIFDFALTMCIGIIFGTFGTLFIATPLMVNWYRGRRPGFEAAKKSIG